MMRNLIRKISILLSVAIFLSMNCFAEGFFVDAIGTRYIDANNKLVVGEWRWIDTDNDGIAECYRFNDLGYMMFNLTYNGKKTDEYGRWIEDGEVKHILLSNGMPYYPNPRVTDRADVIYLGGVSTASRLFYYKSTPSLVYKVRSTSSIISTTSYISTESSVQRIGNATYSYIFISSESVIETKLEDIDNSEYLYMYGSEDKFPEDLPKTKITTYSVVINKYIETRSEEYVAGYAEEDWKLETRINATGMDDKYLLLNAQKGVVTNKEAKDKRDDDGRIISKKAKPKYKAPVATQTQFGTIISKALLEARATGSNTIPGRHMENYITTSTNFEKKVKTANIWGGDVWTNVMCLKGNGAKVKFNVEKFNYFTIEVAHQKHGESTEDTFCYIMLYEDGEHTLTFDAFNDDEPELIEEYIDDDTKTIELRLSVTGSALGRKVYLRNGRLRKYKNID